MEFCVDTRLLLWRGVWGNAVSPQRGVGKRSVPTEGCGFASIGVCGFAKRAQCPHSKINHIANHAFMTEIAHIA
jgi:hypothetical protein